VENLAHFNRLNQVYGHSEVTTMKSDFGWAEELSGSTPTSEQIDVLETALSSIFAQEATEEEDWDGFSILDNQIILTNSIILDLLQDNTLEQETLDWYDRVTANEMSGDQIFHITMGLSLVAKYAENSPGITDIDGNFIVNDFTSFSTWAKNYADIIGEYCDENNWKIPPPSGLYEAQKVRRGGRLFMNADGLNHAIWNITGNHHDNGIGVIKKEAWQVQKFWPSSPTLKTDNRHMCMTLAALGNSWKNTYNANNTARKLFKLGDASVAGNPNLHWDDYYLLLWAVTKNESLSNINVGLLGTGDVTAADEVEDSDDLLRTMPCEGNVCFSGSCDGEHSWHSTDRFLKKREAQLNGSNGAQGHFTSLDYMLLHNLILVYQDLHVGEVGSYGNYTDYIDRCWEGNVDLGNINNDEHHIVGFETLKINGTVTGNSSVVFKAPSVIDGLSGLTIDEGSNVDLVLGEITCLNGNYKNLIPDQNVSHGSFNRDLSFDKHEELPKDVKEQAYIDQSLRVVPNPNYGSCTVQFLNSNVTGIQKVLITTNNGVTLDVDWDIKSETSFELNLQNFSKGIYNLSVVLETSVLSTRIVKM